MTIADLLRKNKWDGAINVCVVCRIYDELQPALEHTRSLGAHNAASSSLSSSSSPRPYLGAVIVTDSMFYLLRINNNSGNNASGVTAASMISDVSIVQEDVVECIMNLVVHTAPADEKCTRDVSVFELRTFGFVAFFVLSDNAHHNSSGTTVEGVVYSLHCMPVISVERKAVLLSNGSNSDSIGSAGRQQSLTLSEQAKAAVTHEEEAEQQQEQQQAGRDKSRDRSAAAAAAKPSASPSPPAFSPDKGQQVIAHPSQPHQQVEETNCSHSSSKSGAPTPTMAAISRHQHEMQIALMDQIHQEMEDRSAIGEAEAMRRVDSMSSHHQQLLALQYKHLSTIVEDVKKVNTTTVFVDAKSGLPKVADPAEVIAKGNAAVNNGSNSPADDATTAAAKQQQQQQHLQVASNIDGLPPPSEGARKLIDQYEQTVRVQLDKYFTVTQKTMFEQCKKVERDHEFRHHVQAERSWNAEREELYRNLRGLSEQFDHLTYSNEQLLVQAEEGRSRENAMLQRFRKRETELHQQIEHLQHGGAAPGGHSNNTTAAATASAASGVKDEGYQRHHVDPQHRHQQLPHSTGGSVSSSRSTAPPGGKPKMFDFFSKR